MFAMLWFEILGDGLRKDFGEREGANAEPTPLMFVHAEALLGSATSSISDHVLGVSKCPGQLRKKSPLPLF